MQFFVTDGSVETHRGAKSEENADRLGARCSPDGIFLCPGGKESPLTGRMLFSMVSLKMEFVSGYTWK